MRYCLYRWCNGEQSLFGGGSNEEGTDWQLLADQSGEDWILDCGAAVSLSAFVITEITEEEAVMILFQAREPA